MHTEHIADSNSMDEFEDNGVVNNPDIEKFMMQQEIQKLNAQLNQMKKVSQNSFITDARFLQIVLEKDCKIKQQETEITNLRKKNYEFRSKNTELSDQLKAIKHNS